jgi:replication-associated recombination protein RarA
MVKTKNGYDFHELLSALQKCIRRNREYEAVFFALKLEEFNSTALWNRLKMIASEDVGCANPNMPILIEILLKHYSESKSRLNDNSYSLFVVNAVVNLCRSPHSRVTDDLLYKIQKDIRLLPIPDFALDGIHTRRCTKEGKENWDLVVNEPFSNPYKKRC